MVANREGVRHAKQSEYDERERVAENETRDVEADSRHGLARFADADPVLVHKSRVVRSSKESASRTVRSCLRHNRFFFGVPVVTEAEATV